MQILLQLAPTGDSTLKRTGCTASVPVIQIIHFVYINCDVDSSAAVKPKITAVERGYVV